MGKKESQVINRERTITQIDGEQEDSHSPPCLTPLCVQSMQDLCRRKTAEILQNPLLLGHLCPVVASGGNVSLLCSSQNTSGAFHLLKRGSDSSQHMEPRNHAGRWWAVLPVDPVGTSHAGTYRCHGSPIPFPSTCTPLDILIIGMYTKPSFSAQPGPSVPWRENVIL
ncbi:LOW QUALITY PROTEIN: killer cell immunoglobulin-like receptor 2DL5B [Rhynchonycteris naso]